MLTRQRLSLIADVLTIIVAILLIVIVIKSFLIPWINKPNESETKIGDTFIIKDIDYGLANYHIFIALSQGCIYCESSMPLYRKILRNSNFQNSRIHFVFDNEDAMNAEGYLEKFGIINTQRTFEVNYVSFYENNINSTPTLIVTDNKDTIIKQFVGTIAAELEDNLLNTNNANDSN